MEAKRDRRKNYFIDRRFQTQFILKFCSLIVLGGMFTLAILYCLTSRSTTVAVANSKVVVRTTADFILPVLIQTVAAVTIMVGLATIVVTLFISHKIAGPLYRFKKVMESLEKGDFSSELRIRHPDQLQAFADVFNSVIHNTRQELMEIKRSFYALRDNLEGISESEIPEHKRDGFRELKKKVKELEKAINTFKT